MRHLKKTSFSLLASFLLLSFLLVLPSSASAGEPWWHIQQVAVPTHIDRAREAGEVQTLTLAGEETPVKVRGAEFELLVNKVKIGVFATEPLAAKLKSEHKKVLALSSEELQAALENETVYGNGNVTVGEVPGVAAETSVFHVTTVGAEMSRKVAGLEVKEVEHGYGKTSVAVSAEPVPAGEVVVRAIDVGNGPIMGETGPVTIGDVLPEGLQAVGIAGSVRGDYWDEHGLGVPGVSGLPHGVVSCSLASLSCTYAENSIAFNLIEVRIPVIVTEPQRASGDDDIRVSGGGAPSVTREQFVSASEEPVPFGVEDESLEMTPEEEGGVPATQAGGHPFQFTTAFTFENTGETGAAQPAQPRNLHFRLPPGLIGNAQLLPRCPVGQFDAGGGVAGCPADTVVGVAVESFALGVGEDDPSGLSELEFPLFNLEPGPGEPARFAFKVSEDPIFLTTSVRTGSDYGVEVHVDNITQLVSFSSSLVTFWGEPNSPAHNAQRGYECLYGEPSCQALDLPQSPFLTMPDTCETPFQGVMEANAWTQPKYLPSESLFKELLDGCNQIPFSPAIEKVTPDKQSASTATGLTVHVHLPQKISETHGALGEGTIRDTTVALPAGVQLNPADAEGLTSCNESQIGLQTEADGQPEHGANGELEFTSTLPEGWEEGQGGFCPKSSKIGTVSISTPLLKEPVRGAVYLATPAPNGETGENPFNGLVAMYIVAENREAGVAVKLPGKVAICRSASETIEGMTCGAQGQLVTTVDDTPQLPFEDLELYFFGGANSPLSTPAHCGAYITQAVFTPWSGDEPVHSTSTFDITNGPGCNGVPYTLPFDPALTAEDVNVQAGGFSPFSMTMSREDGNQNLQAIELKMPPGLSGILNGVELCGEAQADAGTCGPNSQIGETTVSVGVGGDPYTVTGGKVYLTGPYNGSGSCIPGTPGCAPFGLSIVNPANAGPFHLGNVIVRARIEVNPTTAALTVTSNNSGPYKIPQFIDGIPLQIKHVNVTVGANNHFTFNPTSCEHMAIEGSLSSTEGVSKALSVPFQATNCASLKFTPKFSVSTSGKTSKADGASLTAKLSEPSEPQGSQANIARVKVDLPKQLPSRLTTLQKACTAAQFESNPAGCPSASKIGYAKVITPLLPVPLEGPAIFVSHGGEAFPSLTMVLQGYGVTVELVGTTFISKTGITSTTFKTVPDVPFNTFELTLPEGKYSALAANGSLCAPTKTVTVKKKVKVKVHGKKKTVTVKKKVKVKVHGKKKTVTRKVKETKPETLQMPTEFVAQNGAAIHETTPVSVTGCAKKVVKHKKAKKKAKKAKKAKKRK